APLGRARGDEQVRHLLGVHVFVDGGVGRRAEALEDQQRLVAFHQLARLLHRLGRAVAVIVAYEVDRAAVDAAIVIDLLDVGVDRLGDLRIGRRRPAIGLDVPDLDLRVGDAWRLRESRQTEQRHRDGRARGEDTSAADTEIHYRLSLAGIGAVFSS